MEVTEPDGEISVGRSVSSLQELPLEETKETRIVSHLNMFQIKVCGTKGFGHVCGQVFLWTCCLWTACGVCRSSVY